MALVDPYSPCPCGSEKKFKWCCQKVAAYAERAHRLEDNGQHNAALAAYDEGLAKVPRNPWLLLRKSVLLIELQKLDEAKRCVATVLQYQPDNLGASVLLCRLVLATEGPAAAVAELQRARSCTPGPKRESSSSGSPRSWRASWPRLTISRPL